MTVCGRMLQFYFYSLEFNKAGKFLRHGFSFYKQQPLKLLTNYYNGEKYSLLVYCISSFQGLGIGSFDTLVKILKYRNVFQTIALCLQ
jgi:hypothetical protein